MWMWDIRQIILKRYVRKTDFRKGEWHVISIVVYNTAASAVPMLVHPEVDTFEESPF